MTKMVPFSYFGIITEIVLGIQKIYKLVLGLINFQKNNTKPNPIHKQKKPWSSPFIPQAQKNLSPTPTLNKNGVLTLVDHSIFHLPSTSCFTLLLPPSPPHLHHLLASLSIPQQNPLLKFTLGEATYYHHHLHHTHNLQPSHQSPSTHPYIPKCSLYPPQQYKRH